MPQAGPAPKVGPPRQPNGTLARIARFSIRHRLGVFLGWISLLICVVAISGATGTNYANNFSLPGTESQKAVDLLQRDFRAQSGDTDQIVLHSRTGKVTDAAVRARVAPMLARVSRLPHVGIVVSPYSKAGDNAVSPDGTIAFATVNFDQSADQVPKDTVNRVISTAQAASSPQLQVELGGQAIEQAQQGSLGASAAVGLLAAIVVLLITFGSFTAMGLPIVTALLGLGTGVALISIGTNLTSMPDFSTELAVMIGLGVGIDYALFILTRFRENYRSGIDVDTAIVRAMDTAGRAVLFAGCTVVIALMGMFTLGVDFLNGAALASSLAVLMTMLAALTVLPVLLSRFGRRVGRRWREKPRPAGTADAGFWFRWSAWIQRHPWPGAVAGLAIMLVLAAPALAMRLGNSDAGNDPPGQTTREAYDLLAAGFGKGFNGPLQIVVLTSKGSESGAVGTVSAALRQSAGIASVSPPQLSPGGRAAVIQAFPDSSPQASATTDLVNRLRDDTLPAVERQTGTTVLVGGPTATNIDFTNVLAQKLPLFIGIVVLLSALLLMVVFRSLVIPVQAAVMNLLSIGASLGVVVAVFQWGWLGGLLGVTNGPIDAFLPVFVFAIVFGLSMDYEVFLVSRIHEEWVRRRDASAAVTRGLASTGRVITAAATIMVCVFLSFALGNERVLKLFGVSLASAVFLDAFVVRSLLLPSALELLGRRTWALPSWLDRRLPHLAIDGETVAADRDGSDEGRGGTPGDAAEAPAG
ncbi:MAG: MMPL family transporter [Solirubrobacterales bacterium]